MSSGYYLTSPFYYFNLGAHMMYILRNRLEAQSVKKEKVIRILEDISNAIFKEHFIQNLLLPQDPFNIVSLKDVFSRLAHSSIMKLDQSSMDKMFYLMLMSTKKEFFLSSSPLQIFTLTLSHLLNIAKCLKQSESIVNIEFAIQKFQTVASKYSFVQYLQIRQSILSELQKFQTKIVNFIQNGYQTTNGKLIFRLRNSHNQKSIGSAVNQTDQDWKQQLPKPEAQLFYSDWVIWRTSLVIDFVEDYKKSSQKRSNIGKSYTGVSDKNIKSTQQGLQDILSIKFDDIQNYEVKFDMFQSQNSVKIKDFLYQQQQNQRKNPTAIAQGSSKTVNSFKNKIQKEFSQLKLQKKEEQQQEPDLLDMMDN